MLFSLFDKFLAKTKFHGDTNVALMYVLERQDFSLAPAAATEVFQNHCEGDVLIKSVQECLDELCSNCHLKATAVVEQTYYYCLGGLFLLCYCTC